MWPFRKTTTLAQSGILKGITDCHSHLLPGVDDGVETLDESLRILDTMEKQGVRKVWLTPHIMEDIPNETATLREKFRDGVGFGGGIHDGQPLRGTSGKE